MTRDQLKIMSELLKINNLCLSISSDNESEILKNINFSLKESEILSLIGESGSGKSLTALSIIRLLENNCRITSGDIIFNNKNLLSLEERSMRIIRRNDISMIFQEPMRSLNPVMSITDQLEESYKNENKKDIKNKIVENLISVGINDAERVMSLFPHQLSGGMKQRIMIAMAIACKPKLLIADEPTTSLDVTIQKQVLDLLLKLKDDLNMSILFITHDLAVASQISDRIVVMKSGEIVEDNYSMDFFKNPKSSYSKTLLESSSYTKRNASRENKENQNVLEVNNLKVYFKEKKTFFIKRAAL